MVENNMGQILIRKDNTSIACSPSLVYSSKRKIKLAELTIAVLLIVLGTYVMLLVQ
jgi:hypothetical protein